jgi:filamentous hemagglutinin family protein
LNRIFRLVLCRAAGQWVPVSEETRGAAKGRRRLRRPAPRRHLAALALLTAALDMSGLAQAAPGGAHVTAGTGTVSQTGNTTTIRQTSADLFLNWKSFNVAANETVDFIQPSATSIAVNFILGNTASQIFGHLDANGQVWLINPNGILFGAGAQVNVGGLTASTLDLSDTSFSANLRNFSGPGTGSVVNQGSIQAAPGGYVALLGNRVSNQGTIRAQLGTVALGAGSAETLTFSGRQLIHLRVDQSTLNDLAANGQLIQADGGRVIMTAGAQNSLLASAVNNTGIVQARSVENHAGTITLLAGMTAGEVSVGGTLDATAPAGEPAGSIETSGASVSLASTAKIVAGPGGSWRIDPMDLTITSSAAATIDTSLNNGTSVTEATTATTASGSGTQSAGAGDINVSAPILWTNPAATLTLSAYHAINVNASDSVTGAGALVMQAGAAITVGASINAAGQVTMQAGTGNLTIASGVSIEGDAGVRIGSGANFVNNGGPGALISAAGWRVYSTNPTADTTGGLIPGFVEYNAAFGAAPVSQATGNGLLYSVAPSITVTALGGNASKIYDGGANATLTSAHSNYTVTGALNGDTVSSMIGTYQTANVGSAIPVTSPATAAAAAFVVTNAAGVPVYGYGLAGTPVTASIGAITAAQLSAAIVGDSGNPNLSKVYDGTTTATLNSGNYQLTGFATGESASVNQPSVVAYAAASAGAETLSATFAGTNFVAGSSTKLSNYILPTTATGSGIVLQAPLVISGVLATDKVYDSTTTDSLNTTNAGMYGVIGSDVVSLTTSGATGTFSSPNVGSKVSVSTSGFSLGGAQSNDYQLIAPASLTANITQAPLSVTGVSAADKVYNGSAAATLVYGSPHLSGLLGGDGATVLLSYTNATGVFSSKNVGAALPVTTGGFTIAGTNASNYDLSQPGGLIANITPAPLTVNLIGDPTKPYNGTTTAALSTANFSVTGFVAGEGATVPQTSLSQYASPNAGVQTVTATLAVTDFATTGGALLSNYSVPTSVTGTGTITPAPLTGMIVGNPTKVYNGSPSAALTGANYVLTGFLTGQGVTVNQPSGLYASPNAGLQPVTATLTTGNYTGTGSTLLSNYSLPTTLTGTGTITPAQMAGYVYAGITGNPTKAYDGTTTATLTPADFVLTGFMGGDGATVNQTAGVYASANAGVETVSTVLTNNNFSPTGSTNLLNYHLPTSAYGSGTITPLTLTVAVINDPTRVYNGATSTVLLSSNYQITGFVNGEGAQINPSALINYGSANVGSQTITAALTPSAYTATGPTLLSNYVLATSASGNGTITSAPVYVTGVYATNKVYDTTGVDPLNTGSKAVAGVVSSDAGNVSLSGTPAGAFATNQVGVALPVTVSGLTIIGTAASNYTLQPMTGLTASITPAPLTLTGVSAISKPYDGTALAQLNTGSEALVGVYAGDTVTPSSAGAAAAFASVDVGSNLKVTATGFVINGGAASNYLLSQPTGLAANITPAPVTAQITGDPTKVYDGSASTTLTNANYTLVGFATVGSVTQGATVPQSATANYSAPDAGTGITIGSTLVLSDFVANAGTNLSNYQLPTTGSGTGTITQAPLGVVLIGNPTKMYDSTTAATLTSANYVLSGFVAGQSTTVTQAAGTYASANAGSRSVTATLGAGDYAVVSGTNLANYVLPGTATGTGTITRVPLTVTVSTTPQPYNGTTVDALTGATLSMTGVYSGDAPALAGGPNFTGTLGLSGNAGTDPVTTAFALSGTNSANYVVTQPSGLTAVISPVQLFATASLSKTYDGTDTASLSGSHTTLTGFVSGQGASVNSGVNGTFASPNVNTGIVVTGPALLAGNLTPTGSTLLSNYLLPTSDDGTGAITLKALTYTATPSSQQYGLFSPSGLTGTITGFVNSETLNGDIVAGSMSGTMVFTTGATVTSNVGSYAINGSGLTASNYSFSQASGNSNALTITAAPLTVSGVATTSRQYDGTSVDALSGATLSGTIYNGDSLTLTNTATGMLANSGNVGMDGVTTSMSLTGTRSGNYSLTQETGLTANITALALTATSSVTRSYTGTTVANLSGANTIFGGFATGQGATVNAGVTGTFADANVAGGIGITGGALGIGDLTANGSTVLANYTLPVSDNGSGTITPAIVNLSGTRVYDGMLDANASIFGSAGTVAGVNGQNLTLSGSGTLTTKNVITNGVLGTIGGLTLGNGTGSASNYQLMGGSDLVTVTPLAITVTAAGVNKVYNDNLVASVNLSSAGVLSGDNLTYADTSATFASKNVANGVAVSVLGITESGTGAGNYTVNGTASTNANITPLGITVTATGINKVYDGGVTAGVTLASGGVLSGDNLTYADTSATFFNKNVANGVAVSVAGITESGTGAGNYTVNSTASTNANITPLGITVTATGINKMYNDNLVALVTLASGGVLSGDSLTFADTSATFATKNVANGLLVSVGGITKSGTDSGDYTLNNSTATTSANITPAIVNLSGTRVYDGLLDANASIFGSAGTVAGVNGENLTLGGSGTLTTKNVVANGVLGSIGGLTLGNGTGSASNYQLAGGSDVVTVTPLAITVTAAGIGKVYNGNLVASVNLASGGVLSGDNLTYADASATFASKDVANGVAVSVGGITESGTGAGNYSVNSTASTTANITPAIVNLTGSRSYDALLDASAGIFGTAGVVATGVGAETLVLSGNGVLVSKNAGTQGLSSLGTLALVDGTGLAIDYRLSGGSDVVTVTPLAITVAGTANNKTYDGTTTATLSALGSSGVIAGDIVSFTDTGAAFANRNVGNGTTVAINGISAAGADAGNYRFDASATTTADVTPATLTETAIPVSVAAGKVPNLSGAVSGFVPGDTRANATDGTLVWATNAPVAATPGTYAIDGSGLTAENYVVVQSPINADALTITAAPAPAGPPPPAGPPAAPAPPAAMAGTAAEVSGLFGSYLAPADIATPYGVGSANDYGNNTGNARRDNNPKDGNRHLSDFTGRLALTVIGAGITMPPEAAR